MLVYNTRQKIAEKKIKKFISSEENFMLLLGPGGSGKTTVVGNTLENTGLDVIYSSFTNKAVRVLKKNSRVCVTLNKLLNLTINYSSDKLDFKFNVKNTSHLLKTDIIIIDECSVISSIMLDYILETVKFLKSAGSNVKVIFLGDEWQMPPNGLSESPCFNIAKFFKWRSSRLTKIVRSDNDEIRKVNERFLKIQVLMGKPNFEHNKFLSLFPSIVLEKKWMISDINKTYFEMKKKTNDVIIITYSKHNCLKNNTSIQKMIDKKYNRATDMSRYQVGDRCCVERSVNIAKYIKSPSSNSGNPLYIMKSVTPELIYSGELLDVISDKNITIKTILNTLDYTCNYFDAQLLTVKIGEKKCNVVHINMSQLTSTMRKIKNIEKKNRYRDIIQAYYSIFPKINRGYVTTVCGSQGSEFHSVIVNLSSIYWSLKTPMKIYKAVYTACSRAKSDLAAIYYS